MYILRAMWMQGWRRGNEPALPGASIKRWPTPQDGKGTCSMNELPMVENQILNICQINGFQNLLFPVFLLAYSFFFILFFSHILHADFAYSLKYPTDVAH